MNSTKFKDVHVVRIGDKKNISKEVATQYIMEAIRKNMFSSVKEKSTHYIESKLELFAEDDKEQEKWLSIKELQEDWIKRCGDFESFDYQVINCASIIAGTCVGYLSNEFVRDIVFDYVIVDEAAKATTPELLVSIIKAKKIILVGDQKQLPPFADSNLSKLSVELVKNPENRLFYILFNILPDTHKQILTTQYRMIRNIGDLISIVFYDGLIDTGINDKLRKHKVTFYSGKSIIWYNTSHLKNNKQLEQKGGSYINQGENKVIKKILSEMNSLNVANELDIGIITGYSAQKNLIKKSIDNGNFTRIGNIDVNTLDAFQGRENDIIIYSTVRTSKSIGFQKEKERVNVAFSRAKELLIICGDLDFFYSWNNIENKFPQIIGYIKSKPDECMIIDIQEEEFSE